MYVYVRFYAFVLRTTVFETDVYQPNERQTKARSKRRSSHVPNQTWLGSTLEQLWSDGWFRRRTCVELNSGGHENCVANIDTRIARQSVNQKP